LVELTPFVRRVMG